MDLFKMDNNFIKTLTESISEGVLVINESQEIVAANSVANNMFDYIPEELSGKKLSVIIPSELKNFYQGQVNSLFPNQKNQHIGRQGESFGLRKNGDKFPIEIGLNRFQVFENNYILAIIIDITNRKNFEKDLKHWTTIFNESLNEIYIFHRESLKFIDVNNQALKNIGYSLTEMKKMTVLDILPEFDKNKLDSLIASTTKKEEIKIRFETVHLRKDGSKYPVEVHLQFSSTSKMDTFIAIVLDITESSNFAKKLQSKIEMQTLQLQEELFEKKEANRLKINYLSKISPEFKSALSVILTSSILTEKYSKKSNKENINKHLNIIQTKVKFLNNVLNDLLSIEKPDQGKVKYCKTKFLLSEVIDEVLYNANMQLKEGQKINKPENGDRIEIYSDPNILILALSNLLNNAIKFSSGNKKINIEIAQSKKWIQIHIIDEGMGIPKDEQEFIFKRFYRASNAYPNKGSGIGLNIVKVLLENLGGTIFFKSEENKGSIFIVKLPYVGNSE